MLRQIAPLIFSLILFAPVVNADPITVSGSITLVNTQTPSGVRAEPFVLTGEGFTANILTLSGAIGLSTCSSQQIAPNPPCSSANLSWTSVGTDIIGSFTINGQTFGSNVLNQLSLNFQSVVVPIPPELLNAPGVIVTAPFSFTGFALTLEGLSADLIGDGTVTLLLVHRDLQFFSGLYLERATYTFGPVAPTVTVEAVPEPATLVLLVSGLAGAGILKRKRKRT